MNLIQLSDSNKYQFIKLPSRDVISLSGRGFLSEFIDTNNQNFILFYNTYETMREIK